MRSVVSTWFGTFVVNGASSEAEARAPEDDRSLVARARARRRGERTPEDETILAGRGSEAWTTRDRRLAGPGISFEPSAPTITPAAPPLEVHRRVLLEAAEEDLRAAWDPSVHVEEATRALRDLDRASNLLGERLASWIARDSPDVDPSDPARAAARAIGGGGDPTLAPADPALADARRDLARLYESIRATREALDHAIAVAVPERTPNLSRLLGAELAAAMLAQAGGLDRLARLPASTVQVLGAEKAFFEHLRGRAPPPRHGLLFLHPSLQSAPRTLRGRLARTLAGKVAIAARLDQAGAPIDPSLRAAFDRRETELKQRAASGPKARRERRSGPPLHAAADDR